MAEQSLKDKTAKGLMWGGLSTGMTQLLSAVFGIVLLNILSPSDYGKIAIIMVFNNIAGNLQESGFVAALINKKKPTEEEYNAVFWFNTLVGLSIYVLLWFAAPYIAAFFHEPELTSLSRFVFTSFVIYALCIVPKVNLQRELKVRETSMTGLTALIISNIVGVVMALNGMAYWGLATQSVCYMAIYSSMIWYLSPWRPSLHINLRPAYSMFGFGSKLLITNLFGQLNSQVLSLLLGRLYNTHVVGFYSNARKWDDMAANTLQGMMSGVSQPVLSRVVDDDARYRQVFRKMLRFISFVAFPCMLGLSLIAKEFILIVVGEKWLDSALMLSMLCLHGAFVPITELYSKMAISRGKSGVNMFCTITLCIITWIGLISMHTLGIYYMIVYFIIANVLWLFVWQWFAWRIVRLPLLDALKDVAPFFIFAASVMCVTWFITQPIDNIYLRVIAKIVIAAVLYVGITWVSGAKILRESVKYLMRK